jgi:hypothetical protein
MGEMADYHGLEADIDAFGNRCATEDLADKQALWDLAKGVRPGSTMICRVCKVGRLYWKREPGKTSTNYVLYDGRTGDIHSCSIAGRQG